MKTNKTFMGTILLIILINIYLISVEAITNVTGEKHVTSETFYLILLFEIILFIFIFFHRYFHIIINPASMTLLILIYIMTGATLILMTSNGYETTKCDNTVISINTNENCTQFNNSICISKTTHSEFINGYNCSYTLHKNEGLIYLIVLMVFLPFLKILYLIISVLKNKNNKKDEN